MTRLFFVLYAVLVLWMINFMKYYWVYKVSRRFESNCGQHPKDLFSSMGLPPRNTSSEQALGPYCDTIRE